MKADWIQGVVKAQQGILINNQSQKPGTLEAEVAAGIGWPQEGGAPGS